MNVNQEQLMIFKTVIETGSFSAAARKLGKVPSAISMSIANLELDLNLQLFHRKGREPQATQQALVLYEKSLHLLTEMNQWKQQAHALSEGLESELNIVVVSELLHTDWTHFIALLAQQFPTLQINIFSTPQEDALKMLMNQTAQLALMFEREQLEYREQFIEFKKEVLIPVASLTHPLSKYDRVSFEHILQSRQIVVASRDRLINPDLLYSKDYWRTDNHHSACSLILQGLGWGILPLQMFEENPHLKKRLKVLDILDFTAKFEYFVDLVWNRENNLGTAARFLINQLKNQRNYTKLKDFKTF